MFGCGPIGLGMVLWLVDRGVTDVVALDLSQERLQRATALGALEPSTEGLRFRSRRLQQMRADGWAAAPLQRWSRSIREAWQYLAAPASDRPESLAVDELDAWAVTAEPMLMRARASLLAGRPGFAWTSLATLVRTLERPLWSSRPPELRARLVRSALELATELPPDPRSDELGARLQGLLGP